MPAKPVKKMRVVEGRKGGREKSGTASDTPAMRLHECTERICATNDYKRAMLAAKGRALPPNAPIVTQYDRCGVESCAKQFGAYIEDMARKLEDRASKAAAQKSAAAELRKKLRQGVLTMREAASIYAKTL